MNNKAGMAVAFAVGLAVGLNWPKMKKYVQPYLKGAGKKGTDVYGGLLKFMGEQKERVEDALAEIRTRKVAKAKKGVRKRARKLVTATTGV